MKTLLYAILSISLLSKLASCQDFYDGCSDTKGCQGFPVDCVKNKNCIVAVSYEGVAVDKYKFEIIGAATGDLQYIASGLSYSGSMSNASVVTCHIRNKGTIP